MSTSSVLLKSLAVADGVRTSEAFTILDRQQAAVWRNISSENYLFAFY